MSQQIAKIDETLDPNSSVMKPPEQLDAVYGIKFSKDVAKTLWSMIQPYFWKIFFALFLNLVAAITLVAGPYFVRLALDDGIAAGDSQLLLRAIMGYVAIAVLQWISTFWRFYIMSHLGQSIN